MSSGQSQMIQFIIFFLVGMTLFIGIGNFFRIQSESLQSELSSSAFELMGNYFASAAVASVDACKQCGIVENDLRISDTVFGYYLRLSASGSGLSVATAPPTHSYNTSVNNLNATVTFVQGSAASIQPINLTYDRNQNTLEIK
ncbi:MAG: hypothetical protein NT016_02425 [Candidatus Aenigmarchaeota archaeon]|nr:hypothetical protein [Candidatus Aenigmarchaeota archaeon]